MFTGQQGFPRTRHGAWVMHGLGCENRTLPGFVVSSAGPHAALWGSSFLPAAYQGTRIADLKKPIANLGNPRLSVSRQRRQLDMVNQLNQLHRREREDDSRLEARIQSFELAFRMQMQAPDAFNLSAEPKEV